MRIVVVSHAGVVAANRAPFELLACEHGHEVEFVLPGAWKGEYGQLVPDLPARPGASLRYWTAPVARSGSVPLHFYRRRLSGRLRGADLVLADEEPYSLAMGQLLLALRRAPAPLVAYTKQNLAKQYPPPFRWIERAAYAVCPLLLAVSEEAVAALRDKGYRGRCETLPHWVATAARPRPLPERDARLRGFVVGFVGRLVPAKGADVLLHAAAALASRGEALTVVVVGSGPEEPALRALADAPGLRGRVLFVGAVLHHEVPGWMRQMDVLAVPSRTTGSWKEQFGRVLIEAWAEGVPVVGSESGEIPVLLRESGGGVTVPEGDPEALAAALEALARDPARRAALGEAGRRSVERRYSPRAVAARLHEILSGLLPSEGGVR